MFNTTPFWPGRFLSTMTKLNTYAKRKLPGANLPTADPGFGQERAPPSLDFSLQPTSSLCFQSHSEVDVLCREEGTVSGSRTH